MGAKTWDQIELQHRDEDEDKEAEDTDGTFGADDIQQLEDEESKAEAEGGWKAVCSEHPEFEGEVRGSYELAMQDAALHDQQEHDGNPTASAEQ